MNPYETLKEPFNKIFDSNMTHAFFSPGRVNLIGEHTDYNGGHVLPASITLGTYAAVAKNGTKKVRLFSNNFPDAGIITFDLGQLEFNKKDSWGNYVKGMVKYLKEAGHSIKQGLDIMIEGDIPNGSGLSSSASLELLAGIIFEELEGLTLERLDLIKMGRRVENEFFSLHTGIMDQFAIGMGEKNTALLLDTNTLEYEKLPLHLGAYVIVIMNTKKRRDLVDSKYNERLTECQEALAELQTELSAETLGDLDVNTFEKHQQLIKNPILRQRARHAVTENERTLQAAEKLKEGDLAGFGQLMNESHLSLRDDYEVTGLELDTLVEAAWEHPSTLGARMTGAGFGGCAIAIVKKDGLDDFIQTVGTAYESKVGYAGEFYVAEVGDGATML